ncbi:heme lyase CcmF/NrfE family subunit [Phenylobacterium montanum]|uniref:Heme lyase CcmF/NrfE family subunit n=1 Tax=Phenylobacterium montanum TaxID=2823693 RepID=A0A975FVK3_9CAUL|nr:heme lyase CcmF/NrfE family subunit [Caulobacter sp. S6]QUD86110.1 heme lyase CcmF/NrfE family subunit [Caulobacter sp. S6]
MNAEFGSFALVLALALSLAQVALSVAGRMRGSAALTGAGEGAAGGAFAATAFAFGCLMIAFVTSDFSVANVAANSHTAKPLLYKISGVWGSHEGSMLLWDLALTGFGACIALGGDSLPPRLKATTVAVQGSLGLLFIGYTVFASNPLLRVAFPPVEGNSLNPILQDPFLAIHPPFLYSGYVGLSVVFSLAVAGLIEGHIGAAWARWVRPWTLGAWSLLTIGIMLGSFWAYYELGWGGWWFWDPVENASFMPWLAATALLHSAVVTEKRGSLAAWTIFLALLAFTFSMLGAFLVRSGILTSVHAFAVDPKRGTLLLIILGLAAGSGFALFAWRAPALAPGGLFAPISREGALVLNNLFIAISAFAVLYGTLYPLIVQALNGSAISVGPPWFNIVFGGIMSGAILILPIGPLLAWKRGDLAGALQRLWIAAALAVGAGVLVTVLSARLSWLPIVGVTVGAWLIFGALAELAERMRLGRAGPAEAFRRLCNLPRGAFGMTLAHIGVGVFILGAAYETTYRVEAAAVLAPGDHLKVGAYDLALNSVGDAEGKNYLAQRGSLTVTRAGQPICQAAPERRLYAPGRQSTSKVALCEHKLGDVYIVLGEQRPGPHGGLGWLVRAYWNPWARLIFGGPLLMAIGGAVSLSDRRLRIAAPRRAAQVAEARA